MILLTSTSDKLRLTTSAAVNTDVHASFVDLASSGAVTPGRTNTAISTATTTDIVASPSSNVQRNLKTLHVRNKSATTPQDVTVIHTDGTTAVELHKCTLAVGQSLQYVDGVGFEVLDTVDLLAVLYSAQSLSATQRAQARTNIHAAALSAMAMRNLVVNGAMTIAQQFGQNAAQSLTNNTNKYFVDGTFCRYTHTAATAVFTAGQQVAASFPSALANFPFALQMKATTAMLSMVNGDFAALVQYIEGQRMAQMQWGGSGAKDLVVAFWMYSTISGTAVMRFLNNAADRNYYHEFAIAAGWNFVSFKVPGDTSGTWLTDTGRGLLVFFMLASKDTTPVSVLDAWTATAGNQTTNSTNLFANNNNTVLMTGLYMAADTVLPTSDQLPSLMRLYEQELELCKRYLQVFTGVAAGTTSPAAGLCFSTTQGMFGIKLTPAMCIPPTGISISAASDFSLRKNDASLVDCTALSYANAMTDFLQVNATVASGLVAGDASMLSFKNASSKLVVTGAQL